MEKIAAYFRTYLTYLNRNMFIIENDRGDIGEFLQWVMAKCTTSKTVNCGIRKSGGREIEFFMNTRYNNDNA